MKATKASQQGLNRIELLIVLCLLTILILLAVPAYTTHRVRYQVSEGLNLAARWRVAVAEYYATMANMPPDEKALTGMGAASGPYVSGIVVKRGQILITYGNSVSSSLKGRVLSLTPRRNPNNNDIVWICGSAAATLPDGTELQALKDTPAPVTDATAVPAQYLPAKCGAS